MAIAALALLSGPALAAGITNGNFEGGTVSPWYTVGDSSRGLVSGASAIDGQYSIQLSQFYVDHNGIRIDSFGTLGVNYIDFWVTPKTSALSSAVIKLNGAAYTTTKIAGSTGVNQKSQWRASGFPQDGTLRTLTIDVYTTGGSWQTYVFDNISVNGIVSGPAPLRSLGATGFVLDSYGQPVNSYAVAVYAPNTTLLKYEQFSYYQYSMSWQDRCVAGDYTLMIGANGTDNYVKTLNYPASFGTMDGSGYQWANGSATLQAAAIIPTASAAPMPTLPARPTFSPPTAQPVPTVAPYPTYPTGSINPYEYLDYIGQVLTSLVNWLFSMPGYILGEIRSQLAYVVSAISDLIKWVGDSLSVLLQWLGKTVTDSFNLLLEQLNQYYTGFQEKIDELIEAVKSGVSAPLDDLTELIVYPFKAIANLVLFLVSYILAPFISLVTNIKDIYQLAYNVVIGTLATFLIGSWVTLLGAEMAFIVGMRAYYFLLPIVRTVLGWIP